jgi:hypothetical protein
VHVRFDVGLDVKSGRGPSTAWKTQLYVDMFITRGEDASERFFKFADRPLLPAGELAGDGVKLLFKEWSDGRGDAVEYFQGVLKKAGEEDHIDALLILCHPAKALPVVSSR